MEGSSLVSRARTAINSAAAKAEKVFSDIKKSDHRDQRSSPESKEDVDYSKEVNEEKHKKIKQRPSPIKTKHDWHERFRNIRRGKKGAEDFESPTMAYAIFDENLYLMGEKEFSPAKDSGEGVATEDSKSINTDVIPSSAIVKQLAVAIDVGPNYNSMKDLLASSRGSSPIREKASASLSAMKQLVLREKEDKLVSEFGGDEKVLSVINSLLNPEGQFTGRKLSDVEAQVATSLLKDIHGAPIESFVVKLAEAVGCFKTLRKMASFWSRVVAEVRRLWYEEQYIPGIPLDTIPDLNSCLLHQQLQVINCCISRKRRRAAALESLESVISRTSVNTGGSSVSESTVSLDRYFYARVKSGELAVRLGADRECENLTMLETGEPIYSPVMQEPPLLTEDILRETEEFVLRTGSVGAGCSQLLSDMQAFKAANPGCILEDFVRWHSPPDWMENNGIGDLDDSSDSGDSLSVKGQLSMRMQKEGNLWRELWETAKPVPAVRQSPLYDEDLSVEGILDFLEEISPSELFKQLFIAALGAGLAISESTLSTNTSLSNLFHDCKNYVVATCQGVNWAERLDDICQVYETVETMLLNQDEAIKITEQPEEPTATSGDLKNRFKRLSLKFSGKSKTNASKTPQPTKDPKNSEESSVRQQFSSIFSKKPPKPSPSSSEKASTSSIDGDWTIV